MKLLITTQKVDKHDPVLGFFHRWIEEFATHCEKVIVICLEEGAHTFPANVQVLSLGKEHGTSRMTRTRLFYKYIILRRGDYDGVFVHMNPEYVVLGGLLWRMWHKKIVLWYTHKNVDLKLRIATLLATNVATASKESFRIRTSKRVIMGHGIDTEFFSPNTSTARGGNLLSVGRLMKSKRHDLAIEIAAKEGKELHIAGEGPERSKLEVLAREKGARVTFFGGLTQTQLRDEYRKASHLIHTSETGSLDKVVLEALATGLPVRTNDPALKYLESANADYVRREHSLAALVPKLLSLYE